MKNTFMSSTETTSFFASEYNNYKALADQLGMVKN